MSRHRIYPLVLHKSEWERLKKQGGPLEPETTVVDSRKEYSDAMNEQSKKWMRTWPDSAEGVKEKLKKQRRKQHKEDIALVDSFRKSRKYENTQEAVNRAKQLIFNDSCYGRQLISAILESKTLEEREAQIEFQKEIKLNEAEIEKKQIYPNLPFIPLDDKIAEKKLAALECVKINQELELIKKEKAAKIKAEQNKYEVVDQDMIKKIRDAEVNKKAELKRLEKQGIEDYEAENREIEKRRKILEDCNNALIGVYKREQDTTKCKVDAVLKKVIEEKRNGKRTMEYFEMIEKLQKAENKRYEDFIDKGIKMLDERNEMQEKNDVEVEKKKRANLCKIANENKITGDNHKLNLKLTAPVNKCACDVQTLLTKSEADKKQMKINKVLLKNNDGGVEKLDDHRVIKDDEQEKEQVKEDKFSFLKPRNELVQALKRREKESSGWTGANTADKYFAQRATSAIREAKHKYFAKKVVREYQKINNLDHSALSISD